MPTKPRQSGRKTAALIAAASCVALLTSASQTAAQSMWPLVGDGVTFGDRKGQMVTVGNPYGRAETFQLRAYEPDYVTPIDGVIIQPSNLSLGAGATRRVKIVFALPDQERTIAVCVTPSPKPGAMVAPRVCGRYSGSRAGRR